MTIQRPERTEQTAPQRFGNVPSLQQIATPTRIVPATAAAQSAGWQKLTRSGAAPTAGLAAPAASGAKIRTAESRPSNRRAELIAREREALCDIHDAMLASVDDATKEALRPIFASELEALSA